MEKRSDYYRESVIEDIEDQVKLEPPASVWLMSQYPGNLISVGSVTGKRYKFIGGGSVAEVDALDAPEMLTKVFGGSSCCGSGATPTSQFILVEM
jgi:hypothetical protein